MIDTETDPGLSFNFLMSSGDETESPAEVKEAVKPRSHEATPDEAEDGPARDVLAEISDILVPREKKEAAEPPSRQAAEKPEPVATPVKQPVFHDPDLLAWASSWGIGPDDAAKYPTDEALAGAASFRELKFRRAAEKRAKESETPTEALDDLKAPEFKFDEDADPAIKGALESLAAYAQKLKDRADGQAAKMGNEMTALTARHREAEAREARQKEREVAALFDEEVGAWGDEFKEIIGVPSETWGRPDTPQHAEVRKLREYVLERKFAFENLRGQEATLDDIRAFMKEARFAKWPEQMTRSARGEVAAGLKKQKGGVGLRPGRARGSEPVEQGDRAAKAAIGDFMASQGLDLYARRLA